jgi:hypothetical protein
MRKKMLKIAERKMCKTRPIPAGFYALENKIKSLEADFIIS